MAGEATLTPRSLTGPRETTMFEKIQHRTRTSLHVFTHEKARNCRVTLPEPLPSSPTLPNKISYKQSQNKIASNRRTPSPILENPPPFENSRQVSSVGIQLDTSGYASRSSRQPLLNSSLSTGSSPIQRKAYNLKSDQNEFLKFSTNKRTHGIATQISKEASLLKHWTPIEPRDKDFDVPNSVTPIVISSETEQSCNLKIKENQNKTPVSKQQKADSPDGMESRISRACLIREPTLSPGRTSVSDVTLPSLNMSSDQGLLSPQCASSPIQTEPEPINMYTPKIKKTAPQTDALYNIAL